MLSGTFCVPSVFTLISHLHIMHLNPLNLILSVRGTYRDAVLIKLSFNGCHAHF